MNRLLKLLPRLIAVTGVWLLLTAAITYAAGPSATPPTVRTAPKLSVPTTLVVPDVRGQIYVFAKGMLEDAGFAWRVTGSIEGYATNAVVAQTPPPGTRVRDTGSPTIVLRLAHGTYAQVGTPENAAPFAGTKLRLAEAR
jgi:hypothetical protein